MRQRKDIEIGNLVKCCGSFSFMSAMYPHIIAPTQGGYYYVRGFTYHPRLNHTFLLLEEIVNKLVWDARLEYPCETGFDITAFAVVEDDPVALELIQAFTA